MTEPLIKVGEVSKQFPMQGRKFDALNEICLEVYPGETLGLVGESGSGKSTLGKIIVRLLEPTSGTIYYKNQNLLNLSKRELLPLRRNLQIVFQDPYSSLNPRMSVLDIVKEGLDIHNIGTEAEKRARVEELLDWVGLSSDHLKRYPHEFSGGQRQRIAIARALALNPEFLVCDEILSALDLSIQAQIIALLKELQQRLNLAYLFISHDLSAVEAISHRIAVIQKGSLVEIGEASQISRQPSHAYTQQLFATSLY